MLLSTFQGPLVLAWPPRTHLNSIRGLCGDDTRFPNSLRHPECAGSLSNQTVGTFRSGTKIATSLTILQTQVKADLYASIDNERGKDKHEAGRTSKDRKALFSVALTEGAPAYVSPATSFPGALS